MLVFTSRGDDIIWVSVCKLGIFGSMDTPKD